MRTVLRAVIKRVTSRVGMSRAGLEHILKQLHVELGGIPPMARHLVGPHQLPTHFTLLGKSDGRMKMLIADVVLAGAFGVGGVGNSVSSQFMASFRQRSGLLQLERSDAMRCDACSAQGNAAACGVKSKHSRHLLRHVGMQMVDVAHSSFGEVSWNEPTSGVEMVPRDAGAGLQISPKVGA